MAESGAEAHAARRASGLALLAAVLLAAAFAAMLLRATAGRISFPWDLLAWSENPYMAGMAKLAAGQPLFTSPEDVNSYIYSPGLQYLSYAILAPLGLELDVRACRGVTVAAGLAAAAVAARLMVRERGVNVDLGQLGARLLAFSCALLLIFKNHTADVLHPDNAHILHALATLALTAGALRTGSFPMAITAALFASLAVWAKQTAGLAGAGAVIALLAAGPWRRARAWAIAGIGGGAAAISLTLLLAPEGRRIFLFDVVSSHEIEWEKLVRLGWSELLGRPHRLLLAAALLAVMPRIARGVFRQRDPFFTAWAAIGIAEVAPSLLAYLKLFGGTNNLYVNDVWVLVAIWPALGLGAAVSNSAARAAARGAFTFLFVLALFPAQILPTDAAPGFWVPRDFPPIQHRIQEGHWEYGLQIESAVKADLEQGRRVLAATGTAFVLRAGAKEPPLDRISTGLELAHSKLAARMGTTKRIRDGYYEKIYLPRGAMVNGWWFGPDFEAALAENYAEVGMIPDPVTLQDPPAGYIGTGFMEEIHIYEKQQ